jgi:mono/diheme cytochrome c family protein
LLTRHHPAALLLSLVLLACGGDDSAKVAMTDSDAGAKAAAVASLPAPSPAEMDSIGRAVYTTCAICHQANGQGISGSFSPMAGSEIVLGAPEIPVAIILHGIRGPITVRGQEYRGMMLALGGSFDDVQIAAVATYIRSQWGNSAPAVTPELVAKVRAATASRSAMWSWDELRNANF